MSRPNLPLLDLSARAGMAMEDAVEMCTDSLKKRIKKLSRDDLLRVMLASSYLAEAIKEEVDSRA